MQVKMLWILRAVLVSLYIISSHHDSAICDLWYLKDIGLPVCESIFIYVIDGNNWSQICPLILWLINNKNTQTTSNYTIQLLQYIYQCEMCPQIAKSPELNINPKLKI